MTTKKNLIAEAHEHIDKAADAAPVSARQAILTGKVEDQRLSLVARLVHALERVTAERDAALREDAHHSSLLGHITEMYKSVLTERDALAAVVEQVRDTLEHYHGQKVDVAPIDILDMLPSPSVALDHVKAEALREAADGFRLYGDHDYSAVAVVTVENYLRDRADRIEKGEGNG